MSKNDSRGRVEHVDEHQAEGDKQHDSRRYDFLSAEMELMGKTGKKWVSCCLVITLLRQLKLMDIFLLGFSISESLRRIIEENQSNEHEDHQEALRARFKSIIHYSNHDS